MKKYEVSDLAASPTRLDCIERPNGDSITKSASLLAIFFVSSVGPPSLTIISIGMELPEGNCVAFFTQEIVLGKILASFSVIIITLITGEVPRREIIKNSPLSVNVFK